MPTPTGYKQIFLYLNVETGLFTDVSGTVLSTEDWPKLFFRGNFLFCITCVNNDGTAVTFDLSETFSLAIDPDYIHADDNGALTAAHSGTKTEITADGFLADPPDTAGTIRLTNSSGETFDFVFTSWAEAGGVYTFTGAAQDITYSFAENDDCDILEPLMIRSGNAKFNISGDWDDLDVVNGKISVRLQCASQECLDALGDEQSINPFCEINKFYSGTESVLAHHNVQFWNRVDNLAPEPGQVDPLYRTADAQDSIDNLKFDIKGKTEVTLTDEATTNIILETLTNVSAVKVIAAVDDGTNYEFHDILVIHDGTNADLADRFAVQGSRITGLSWTADINSGNLRLNAIVTGVGGDLTCKYRIIAIED
ncbi:MAG: hypothetical protein KAR42_14880 [candidate division Zixibacteria bacterium]|nr:hypothetical protein [candidate division Zixibacteria bacterium]